MAEPSDLKALYRLIKLSLVEETGAGQRLTNAFSKKWENLWSALCLHFAYYTFCRVHKTLRVTPAMQSGITDQVWPLVEVLTF